MKTLDSKGPIILDYTRQTDGYNVYEGIQFGRKVTIYTKPKTHYAPIPSIEVIVKITAYDERKDDPTEAPNYREQSITASQLSLLEEIAGNTKATERVFNELLEAVKENNTPKPRKRASKSPKK